jgi:hypothetical protein
MPNGPQIQFFLSSIGTPVERKSPLWNEPLPLNRFDPIERTDRRSPPFFTYGDYFEEALLFLGGRERRFLVEAASRRLGRAISREEIRSVDIFLEKHGPFYHPSRVQAQIGGIRISLVLNVAVSSEGLKRIEEEFHLLETLNANCPWRFLPEVYCLGSSAAGRHGGKIKMFLGEWIEEYHEFHICGCTPESKTEISVWKGDRERLRLSQNQIPVLYREAAKILTAYYDLHTFDQIFPWHHAAGDFIVRVEQERLDLKLVSVRRYAPTVNPAQTGLKSMFEALLVFLLNLSMRMRLDRLDGVGDTAWADDRAVRSTLEGFFAGMALKTAHDPISEPLTVLFSNYLFSCSESDLSEVCEEILEGYPSDSCEKKFVRERLHSHIAVLCGEIRSCLYSGAPPAPAGFAPPAPDSGI